MRNCIKLTIKATSDASVTFDVHAFVNNYQAYTTVYCSTYTYKHSDTCIEFDAPLMFNTTLAQAATANIANRLTEYRSKQDKKTYTVPKDLFPDVLAVIADELKLYELNCKLSYTTELEQYIANGLRNATRLMPELVKYVNETNDYDLVKSEYNNIFNKYAIQQWIILSGNRTKIVYDDSNTFVAGCHLKQIPIEWCTKNVVQCSKDIVSENTLYESDSITEKALLEVGHTHKIDVKNLCTVEPYKYYN